MKVIVISIICAMAGHAMAGAISWPGAVPVTATILRTVPGAKINAYSTSQYINPFVSSYSFRAPPQFAYHVPQPSYAPIPTGYYSIGSPSYIPAAHIYYPAPAAFVPGFGSAAGLPAFPSAPSSLNVPAQINPALPTPSNEQPEQTAGDSDSAVIDSTEFSNQQQNNEGLESSSKQPMLAESQPFNPAFPQFAPSNSFSNFPPNPQIQQSGHQGTISAVAQLPQYNQGLPPSFASQTSNNSPSFPQISNTQGFVPTYPQYQPNPQPPAFPQNIFSQGPSQAPASFPAPASNEKGLNDEDTVSIESA